MKDYRPISLTTFLLKTQERLVDSYLKEGPLKIWPFHEEQHAYCTGRSVETALLSVVNFVEDQLELKRVCIGAFLEH